MYVTEGARTQLLKDERRRFLDKEWPQVAATIERLGLDPEELLRKIVANGSRDKGAGND
jgi:GntR family transcriptional regulator